MPVLSQEASDVIEGLEERYNELKNALIDKRSEDLKELTEAQRQTLQNAKKYFMEKGDLANTLAVTRELEKLDDAPVPEGEMPAGVDTNLKKVIQAYKERRQKRDIQLLSDLVRLNSTYIEKLNEAEKSLTREAKLKEAVQAMERRKRVETETADLKRRLPIIAEEGRTGRIPESLKKHLVVYYTFDEPGPTVVDHSGNGRHGTARGATWEKDGKVGGCYAFDGKDDWIDLGKGTISKAIDGTKAVTVAFWVKPNRRDPKPEILFVAFCDQRFAGTVVEIPSTGYLKLVGRSQGSDGYDFCEANRKLQPNVWQQVVAIFNFEKGLLQIFVDGDFWQQKTVNFGKSAYVSGSHFPTSDSIGRHMEERSHFEGSIDEFFILRGAFQPNQL